MMNESLQKATEAIYAYTSGMDTGNWEFAVSTMAESIAIDYSAVGMTRGQMSRTELQMFLTQLLGKPDLRVHTAISQVLVNPSDSSEFIACYSVQHFKGAVGQAERFAVFGWYRYRLEDDRIVALALHVTAMEGDPTVLA